MLSHSFSTSFLLLGTIIATSAQIPREVVEMAKEVKETVNTNRQFDAVLPNPPTLGENHQNITVAPVIHPGTTQFSPSGAVSGVTGVNGGGETGKPGGEAEGVLTDRLRNLEVDPAGENVIDGKRGAVWNIFDNRAVDARFDRYLNLGAMERIEQKAYLDRLNDLLQLLCPRNPYASTLGNAAPSQEAMAKAYQLLRTLSRDEYDHGISNVIANEVDSVHAALKERKRLYADADKIEGEIKQLEWNIQIGAQGSSGELGDSTEKDQYRRDARKGRDAALKTAPYVRRLSRAQTQQVGRMAQAEAKLLLAKTEFQTLLVQLFAQRRFQHVLLASAFYRSAFGDGEMEIKTEGKVREMLKIGDGSLTVSTLESMTTEAIREIRQGVSAVNNMMEGRRLQSAEKRLMETYFMGEHLPEMQSFPEKWRLEVLTFRQARREVLKAVEVKDYTRAKEKNNALIEMASDYDPAPVNAAISVAESGSNLHLAQARNAAISGDRLTMEAEVKAAAELWPQNPALAEGAERMMERFDLQAQSLSELDKLLEAGDLRGIEAKREGFAAAVSTDEIRQQRLRKAMEELVGIEKALERAKELDEHGSTEEAWAAAEKEGRRHSKDPKLLAAIAEYGGRAPQFVKSILDARKAATAQPVRAMHLYLLALKENPASEEAVREATRLANLQLASLR